jgi:polar amino acid transport system substrate-binding protein
MAQMQRGTRVTLIIVGVIVLSLVGGYLGALVRGGTSSTTAGNTQSSSWSWVDKVKKNGALRVGVASSPPGIVQGDDGKWKGFELIAPEAIAKTLGVKVKTVSTTFENAVAGLQADQFDMMVSLNMTPDRSLSIRFSSTEWTATDVFLVKADSGFKSADAIIATGKPIAVPAGTSQDKELTALKANVLRLKSYQDANLALTSGRAIASFLDVPGAASFAKQRDDVKILVPNPPISVQAVGYGMSPNIDEASLQFVDNSLDTLIKSGVIQRQMVKDGFVTTDQLGDLELSTSRN